MEIQTSSKLSSEGLECYWQVIDHMEIWFIQWNKMWFLPSCVCVWIHYMDTNKIHKEKARWELLKNTEYYLEQKLETTPHKMAAVRPPTSHLTNHLRKNKQNMQGTTEEVRMNSLAMFYIFLPMHTPVLAVQQKLMYISSVQTLNVAWGTYQVRWMDREIQQILCCQCDLMKIDR